MTVAMRRRFRVEEDEFGAASIARAALDTGDEGPAHALVATWTSRLEGLSSSPDSAVRYPWPISPLYSTFPDYVPDPSAWRAWRLPEEPARQSDRSGFDARLLVPLVLSDAVELLATLAERDDDAAARVLEAALPVVRREIARHAVGSHAWGDTWALWNLARRPRALRRLHPFAHAIADTYAPRAIVQGSVGTGSRFPFHDRPLPSVSAQLATGLLALGTHPKLTGSLAAWTARQELADGGWADDGEVADPIATLVAADLLAGLDPTWDPARTIGALDRLRRPDGTVQAYGPETAWLTLAIDELSHRLGQPFAARFRWPQVAVHERDRRTGLPFLGYLADLERLCVEFPPLAPTPVELAFIDLAGFGAWNNRFGMAAGDEVLRFLAAELMAIPDVVAIRDGGDEFLVVEPPGGRGLRAALDGFRRAFEVRCRARFGDDVPPVAPRIVMMTARAAGLVGARDALGIEIIRLKRDVPEPPSEGVLAWVGRQHAG